MTQLTGRKSSEGSDLTGKLGVLHIESSLVVITSGPQDLVLMPLKASGLIAYHLLWSVNAFRTWASTTTFSSGPVCPCEGYLSEPSVFPLERTITHLSFSCPEPCREHLFLQPYIQCHSVALILIFLLGQSSRMEKFLTHAWQRSSLVVVRKCHSQLIRNDPEQHAAQRFSVHVAITTKSILFSIAMSTLQWRLQPSGNLTYMTCRGFVPHRQSRKPSTIKWDSLLWKMSSRIINGLCCLLYQACMGLIDPAACVFREWREFASERNFREILKDLWQPAFSCIPWRRKPLQSWIVSSRLVAVLSAWNFLVQQVTGEHFH